MKDKTVTIKPCMVEVARCAATEPTRYAIDGVSIQRKNGYVECAATDGRMAMIARLPQKGDTFPQVILPTGDMKKVGKSRDDVVLTFDGKNVHANNGKVVRTMGAIIPDGKAIKFPDVHEVIPKGKPDVVVHINAAFLRTMLQAVESVTKNDERGATVRIEFRKSRGTKGEQPLVIRAKNDDGVELVGVVMPIGVTKNPDFGGK